ncbi:Os10g0149550 [Oryza sativa Japonica Group]|uniref:Os10g0149550 protein n=1 Tax=Oryza sativa subsp. japonica TaxID=39947 RepID=A0A0P0XRP8_ORYSJ|nr:Os10g0149550 [Oryza sativa Japonica Group]
MARAANCRWPSRADRNSRTRFKNEKVTHPCSRADRPHRLSPRQPPLHAAAHRPSPRCAAAPPFPGDDGEVPLSSSVSTAVGDESSSGRARRVSCAACRARPP